MAKLTFKKNLKRKIIIVFLSLRLGLCFDFARLLWFLKFTFALLPNHQMAKIECDIFEHCFVQFDVNQLRQSVNLEIRLGKEHISNELLTNYWFR